MALHGILKIKKIGILAWFTGWTRAETEHLLDLCGRFDLRFTVIQDRWDRTTYPKPKSIEDLKVGEIISLKSILISET